jgi:hypothetical protein
MILKPPQSHFLPALLAAAVLLAGCQESAEDFFSGRPSEMAMVHNRIIGGPPEAMLDLLRVPARFPDAKEAHIANWQESVIAWWRHAEKHEVMRASLPHLTPSETQALRAWVRVRDPHRSREKAHDLDEVAAAIEAAPGITEAR